jgi:hypothetical protein
MRETEEGNEAGQGSADADRADDAEAPAGADPATIALARRAYEAVLAGNRPALEAISQSIEPPPVVAPWPAPPAPGHPPQHGQPASGVVVAGKKASSGAWPAAIAAGALLVFAGAGLGAYLHFRRVPITDTACGQGAVHLISSLKEPLTMTFYVTKGTPKVDRFVEQVGAMMVDLAASSNGKLVYELVIVTTDEQRSQAKEAGLQETMFGEAGTGSASAIVTQGFCGFALKYRTERESIPLLSPDQPAGAPFWIVQKIREIQARAESTSQRFGIVSGKGEIKLSEPSLVAAQGGRAGGPNLKGIMEQAMPYYAFADVDLRGGEAEIDPRLMGVLVTQPSVDYTEKELRRIDQFLMRGGKSVVVFASAVNVKAADAKMLADLDLHGIDRLLAGYGVEMQRDALFDWGHPVSISTFTPAGAASTISASGLVLVEHDEKASDADQGLDSTFVPFSRLEAVVFPLASTLVAHPEKQPGARFVTAARTTAKTTSETKSPLSMYPAQEAGSPAGPQQRHVIALGVEGKLRSAFADRPEGGVPTSAPESSRLLVISSAQFLVNPLARAGNPPPSPTDVALGAPLGDEGLQTLAQPYAQKYLTSTILAFKNTLDWASADDATVSCSATLLGHPDTSK